MSGHSDWRNVETSAETDDQRLRDFGYRPQFRRVLGLFGDFSLGYSYMSPLAGFYALFAYALTTGGPGFVWTMPVVLLGQFLVALVFAEASSQYPIAGGVYQWARRLAGPGWGFLTAWLYLFALLGTIAGLAAGLAPFLATLLGLDAGPTFNAGAGIVVILLAAVVNFVGTRVLGRVAELGVWAGLVGLLVCGVWLLLFGQLQPVSTLQQSFGAGDGGRMGALLAASLIGIWIFFGFEACGDLAEEVSGASRKVPRAMMLTMLAGGVSTLVIAFGMTLAVPDLAAAVSGKDASPGDTVLRHAFGPVGADLVLVCLILVVLSATASIIASASRLLFSMGRDRVLVGSALLSRVDPKRGLPLAAVTVATVVPAALVAVGIFSPDAAAAIISLATAGIYMSFAMVSGASVVARLGGWRPSGHFRMGFMGWPVSVLALAWGLLATLNIVWPRPASADASWYITWVIPISLAVILLAGLAQMAGAVRAMASPKTEAVGVAE